ncbi:MAG TPA: hypothetical protein VH280_00285 [Verrucomicrobiae bacterium]|jgi:hypothetical protein|nr:hypothetical protein [Verrucomicrobiae bacterium]
MLTEHQIGAYRYLLYWALLDFRDKCQPRRKESLNPVEWRRQYQDSRAAAVADNLALYSASDFCAFDEEWFWKEFEGMRRHFFQVDFEHYRTAFERRLGELNGNLKIVKRAENYE